MLFVCVFLLISILSCFWYHISVYLFVSLRISRVRKRKLLSRTLFLLMSDTCDFKSCVTLLLRIANHMVMDSYCRGGIVNTRVGCSFVPRIRPKSSKALWRFRTSTSNSPIDLFRPHTHTQIRHIYQTYAQQGIRVYEDDHFEPPMRQLANPKALSLLRVSI